MVFANAERFPAAVSFQRQVSGHWVDVTARDFAAQVLAVSKGLISSGIRLGDRVGLLARTRYEWALLDFAIWSAGAVTVPIYETSSPEQVEWILSDSRARGVVVETAAHRVIVDAMVGRLAELDHVWQIDGAGDPDATPDTAASAIDELAALGADVADADVHKRRTAVRADDLATVIYTSGTTGRPKGCELTHRNFLAEIRADREAFSWVLVQGNSLLLFLPLAHVLARTIQCLAVYTRVTIGHTPDVSSLLPDLAAFRPTVVLAVPRVFEKVYNGAKHTAHTGGKGKIFDAAAELAVDYSQALERPGAPGMGMKIKHAVADRLVYARLRAALGGRCEAAISGGAPLGERLGHFFRGIGMPVFEGYGLTETTAAACVNTREHTRIGTVGRPLAGTSVRIAEGGEILIRGDIVFRGYAGNAEATGTAVQDGWFHTGDLGELDDGYLRITGRTKEIIVTAGGKNVSPAALEDRLRAHPLISQCMVVGEGRPFIAALITLDPEAVPAWCEAHGLPRETTAETLRDNEALRAEVQAAVTDANTLVSKAESIRKFSILTGDFTEDGGELTPTFKLRRQHITTTYAADIAALYGPTPE